MSTLPFDMEGLEEGFIQSFCAGLAEDGVTLDAERVGIRLHIRRRLRSGKRMVLRTPVGRVTFVGPGKEGKWTYMKLDLESAYQLDAESLVPGRRGGVTVVQYHFTIDGRDVSAEMLGLLQ